MSGQPRQMQRPPIFSDEPFEAARARAAVEKRWLVVDVTDARSAACWAVCYTAWRDPEVVAWLEENAVAVQVDARADAETARALGVDAAAAPTVLLMRDGKERLRLRGRDSMPELLRRFERADVANDNLALARANLKDPERQPFERNNLADALLTAGLLDQAFAHYDWLWCYAVEVDPDMEGVRRSFMAGKIGNLCDRLSAARVRFEELRDLAARAASPETLEGRRATLDFLVLAEITDGDELTLAWFDGLSSEQRSKLSDMVVQHFLLPLLYERERWRDAGGLIADPLAALAEVVARGRTFQDCSPDQQRRDRVSYRNHLVAEGRPTEARLLRRLGNGLHEDVAAIHRSLVAAGRVAEAEAVKRAALDHENSAAMRAALR